MQEPRSSQERLRARHEPSKCWIVVAAPYGYASLLFRSIQACCLAHTS
jgi:hypothetical protein